MPVEIERKFLVINDSWRDCCTRQLKLRQGYLCADENCTVRVRLDGEHGYLTVKGRTENISRSEFEYPVPYGDAEAMLADLTAGTIIEKTRYFIDYNGKEWVVDEFSGRNRGLVLAELELISEDAVFEKPDWIGEEVSGDCRYRNSSLSRKPYQDWSNE